MKKLAKRLLLVVVIGLVGVFIVFLYIEASLQDYRHLIGRCGTDIDRFCSSPTGEDSTVSCLREHAPDVSESCKQAIEDTVGE